MKIIYNDIFRYAMFFLMGVLLSQSVQAQVFELERVQTLLVKNKLVYFDKDHLFFGGGSNLSYVAKGSQDSGLLWSKWFNQDLGEPCLHSNNSLRDFAVTPDTGVVGVVDIDESCVPHEGRIVKLDKAGNLDWEFRTTFGFTKGFVVCNDSLVHIYAGWRNYAHDINYDVYYKFDMDGNLLESDQQPDSLATHHYLRTEQYGEDSLIYHSRANYNGERYDILGIADHNLGAKRELYRSKIRIYSDSWQVYDDTLYFRDGNGIGPIMNLHQVNLKRLDIVTSTVEDVFNFAHVAGDPGIYYTMQMVKFDSFYVGRSTFTSNVPYQGQQDSLLIYDSDFRVLHSEEFPRKSWRLHKTSDSTFLAWYSGRDCYFYKVNPGEIDFLPPDTGTYTGDFSFRNDIKVYPNPAQHVLRIKGSETGDYEMYDLSGKRVKSGRYNMGGIDVGDLAAGAYLLQLHTGESRQTFKVIVQR